MPVKFHTLVRGVLLQGRKALLAHCYGQANTFLPGGHIEPGESAEQALVRELKEELGIEAAILQSLGVIEHNWTDDHCQHQEINQVFQIALKETGTSAKSNESHLAFIWVDCDEFDKYNLQPAVLKSLIRKLLTEKVK